MRLLQLPAACPGLPASTDPPPAPGPAPRLAVRRPRTGDASFNPGCADLLKAMLESSIQRRFPKGLKVHVHSLDRFGCLAALTRVLQQV